MTVPFASLSIHTFVDKIGAYCGFASIIGLAILILLFFSQARETANLRGRLAEAQERINALEGRLVQLMRMPAQRGAGAPAPPPVPAQPPVAPLAATRQPMGTAAASVRRPAPGVAADGAPARYAGAGMGAPALASATSLILTPGALRRAQAGGKAVRATPAATAAASEDTVLVPAGAATAAATAAAAVPVGGGNGRARTAAAAPPPTRTRPAATPPRGAPGGRNAAAARNATARTQGRPDAQSGAPGGRGRGRGQAPPSLQEPPPNHSARRRVLSALAGLVVVAGVVVALLVVTNNGGTTNSKVNHPGAKTSANTHGSNGKNHTAPPAVKPSDVTVAVLNGTAVSGLAADVSSALSQKGYQPGPVANAAVQTQAHTAVAYMSNDVREAQAVAKSLGLTLGSVEKANETTIQSCETPVTGVTTGSTTTSSSCAADVIVTVGNDKASLASSTSS